MDPALRISTARLSDLIGLVYDSVLEPAHWSAALTAIRLELDLMAGVLGVYQRAGRPLLQMNSGLAAEWLAALGTFNQELPDYWGGSARIEGYPLDEPITWSQAATDVDAGASRFHRDWIRPQAIGDLIGVRLSNDASVSGTIATLTFTVADEVAPANERMLAALRLIAPHVRRAVTISGLFEHRSIVASTFASLIDRLTFGILLVDDQARVVDANAAGRAILDARDPVALVDGRLSVVHHAATSAALTNAIVQAAKGPLAIGASGLNIPLRGVGGGLSVLHVLPLQQGLGDRIGSQKRAVAAVFVAPAKSPPRSMIESAGLLLGLTPAEIRVLELVADGQTVNDVAVKLGIAPSTVRTHLQHVFDKTGTSRQVDLVRLAASLSLPL